MHFCANAFDTDFKRKLSYDVLGRNILSCADNYATVYGFGFNDILMDNRSWVISRMTIEISQMPSIYTNYHIGTWIENIYRMFTNRNFVIKGDNGEVFGYARSVWSLIDNETRQPLELINVFGDKFQQLLAPEIPCEINGHSRIRPLKNADPVVSIVTKYNDLDCNGHFNSIKYISHVLDLFSKEFYINHKISRLEIAYVAEAYFGDELTFFMVEQESLKYEVEIRKHYKDDNIGEVIARTLITFDDIGIL